MEKRLKFPETITKDNKAYTFVKQCNNSICLYHRFINGNEIRECFTIQELGIVADCKGKIKNDDIEDGAFADLQKKHHRCHRTFHSGNLHSSNLHNAAYY